MIEAQMSQANRRAFIAVILGLSAGRASTRMEDEAITAMLETFEGKAQAFGWVVKKDGKEVHRWLESDLVTPDFQFNIERVTEVFFNERHGTFNIPRFEKTIELNGLNYVARNPHVEEIDGTTWMTIDNIEPYDAEIDRLHWAVNSHEPIIIHGAKSPPYQAPPWADPNYF